MKGRDLQYCRFRSIATDGYTATTVAKNAAYSFFKVYASPAWTDKLSFQKNSESRKLAQ